MNRAEMRRRVEMEESIRKKIHEVEDYISCAEMNIYDAKSELDDLYDSRENNSKIVIKDIDNFKRELKRDGLYSEKIEDFIESYMRYYNK